MTVLTLAGGTVITPDGPRRMPEPGPAAKMLARLWTVTGPGGLLLLAPGEPSWSYLLTEDSPWTVTGGPAWFTLTRGSDRMRAGVLGEVDLANDPLIGPDLAATTRRHQRFGDLLGVPFYADGGATGALLLDATVNTKGAPVLRAWHDQKAPRAAEGPWPGPWTPRGEYQPGVQLDKNAHFLCAANSAVLPMDGLRPLKADFYEEVAEFWTGLWEIKVPDNPELRLPHPVAGGARPGSWRWVAQPTLDLLAELGMRIEIRGAWVCPRERARRVMVPWYEKLRDARAATAGDDPDSKAVRQAVKDTYSRGIACMDRESRRWFRPDWRAFLYAQARTCLYRSMLKAGRTEDRWPAETRTDMVVYEGDTPASYRIGTGMGEWKVTRLCR